MEQIRRISALLLRRLRLDLRSASGHVLRLFAAGCLLFTIFTVVQSNVSIGAPGLTVYRWIVWVDSLLISIASMTVFATIISAEREQGTLALLRMTGMSPLSLILGQGVSGVVIGCLLIAIQLPFVVLTITLGGILWNQVLATFVALLGHLVLSGGIGLFWSAICLRPGSASFYVLLSQFGLWMGPWLSRYAAAGLTFKGWISPRTQSAIDQATSWIDQQLVWTRLDDIATSFGIVAWFSGQFWFSLLAGAVLVLAAAFLLDRRPVETPAYSPIVIRLWRTRGGRAWPRFAFAGKDYRQFMGGIKGMLARLILYPLVPLGFVYLLVAFGGARMDFEDVTGMVFWFNAAFLTVETAAIASRVFRNEVAEQTWSSLAVLPRWRGRIVLEKLWGCGLGLAPGLVCAWIAGASSSDVTRFFFGPHYSSGDAFAAIMLTIQPLLWVSVTGFAALLLVGMTPTVTIFCGFLAVILQYFLLLMLAMLFWGTRLSFENFFAVYLLGTSVLICVCLAGSLFRLRKLTARD